MPGMSLFSVEQEFFMGHTRDHFGSFFYLKECQEHSSKKIIEAIEIRLIQVTAVGKCSDVVIPTYSFEASYTVNLPPLSGRCFRNGLKSSGSRYWNDFSSRCVISLSRFCCE